MATIKQIYGTNTPVTMTPALTGLGDGAKSVSDEIDNSTGNLVDDISVEGTTGGTGSIDVYYSRANTTGIYPSEDILGNWDFLMSVNTTATTPENNRRMEQLPKFYKLLVVNSTGASLGTTTLSHQIANLTNT